MTDPAALPADPVATEPELTPTAPLEAVTSSLPAISSGEEARTIEGADLAGSEQEPAQTPSADGRPEIVLENAGTESAGSPVEVGSTFTEVSAEPTDAEPTTSSDLIETSESIASVPDGSQYLDGPYQLDDHHVVDVDGELLEVVRDHGPWRLWEQLGGWDRRFLFTTGLGVLLGTFFYCLGLTSLSFAPSMRPKVEAAPSTATATPSNTPIVIFFDPVATETIGPTPTEAPPPAVLPPTPTEPPRRTPTPVPPPTVERVETVAPPASPTFFVPIPPLQTAVGTVPSGTPSAVAVTASPISGTASPAGTALTVSPTRSAGSATAVATRTGTRSPASTASPAVSSATVPPSATRPPTAATPPTATSAPPTPTPAGILPATPTRPTATATSRPP